MDVIFSVCFIYGFTDKMSFLLKFRFLPKKFELPIFVQKFRFLANFNPNFLAKTGAIICATPKIKLPYQQFFKSQTFVSRFGCYQIVYHKEKKLSTIKIVSERERQQKEHKIKKWLSVQFFVVSFFLCVFFCGFVLPLTESNIITGVETKKKNRCIRLDLTSRSDIGEKVNIFWKILRHDIQKYIELTPVFFTCPRIKFSFFLTIKFWSKFDILVKNRNLYEKLKFWLKIDTFGQKLKFSRSNIVEKVNFFPKKNT